MRNHGMTLIEVMMAVSLFTIVMGAIFTLSLSFGDTARVQDIKATANDEARRAFQIMVPQLCQAARGSIGWGALPGQTLAFRTATDLDGNGSAVDIGGNLELSAVKTLQRDLEDLNGDGKTTEQLILVDGGTIRVLANNLVPEPESTAPADTFTAEQDTNGNGRLDRGFWVESRDGGLVVSIDTQGRTRRGNILISHFEEFVEPRN